jgi:prepilin-type N-terminal cleavage/methylation domain-containing protein
MKDRGFSLIELVIVLVLISLSVALVAPSLSRFAKRVELKAAAQKISGILRYFRSESIQKGKVYQVQFDADRREVRVQALEEEGEGDKEDEVAKVLKKSYFLPEGIQMKEVKIPSAEFPSDVPAIEFYPNGGSNGGSVILEAEEQKGYRIRVQFLTGIVEVGEG